MSVRQEVPMTTSLEALQEKRDQLTESLAQLDDWRPGFLTARFRKCGKANCHCAQKGSPGHGPSYSLTHRVGGKTITQVIPQGPAVVRTKAQLAEYRRFRQLVRELIEVSEQICSAKLRQAQTVSTTETKKKTSSPICWPTTSFRRLKRCWGARRWKIWILRLWKWRPESGFCNWPPKPSNNVSMPTPRMKRALVGLAAVAAKRNLWDVAARPFTVCSARCG